MSVLETPLGATIRSASPDDAVLVHRLVCEIAAHEGSLEHVRSDVDSWREMLARPEVRVLIAENGGAALGYASSVRRLSPWMGGDVLALDDLYVREGARSRGVGRRLMLELAKLAAADDLTIVWGARLDNDKGHRFYRRLGAVLTTKVAAAWSPDAYRRALSESQP
jgi:ribosomal protein S18 acetylase RimI-like enzyme